MIQKENLPNLAQDLVRIHKAITRGLTVGATRGAEFIRVGFPDRSMQQGFADYVQSLASVLTAHHQSEDEIAFPALRKRLPAVPYERLAADHKKIEAALGSVMNTLPDVAGANPVAGLGIVVDGLGRVLAVWTPHIVVEEKSFAPTSIAEVMSPDEQAEVSVSMAKHAQEHAGPPFLVIPFVLFNLAGAERAAMAKTMPKVILEQLIPGEWKERWFPMRSFLLD